VVINTIIGIYIYIPIIVLLLLYICYYILLLYICYCYYYYYIYKVKVKVKKSLYKPEQALRVPGASGSQISRQSAHEGGKVVSPTHRTPLPRRKYCWDSFLLEAESTPGP